VKEAAEESPLLANLPSALVRRINGVRLYAPNLRYADLAAPGYYFLATDTPEVMRWLAPRAEQDGGRILYQQPFQQAKRVGGGFDLGDAGTTRYLVGADGPGSRVAATLGLGKNTQFLSGVEYEYAGVGVAHSDKLHCFIDRRLMPGYI